MDGAGMARREERKLRIAIANDLSSLWTHLKKKLGAFLTFRINYNKNEEDSSNQKDY